MGASYSIGAMRFVLPWALILSGIHLIQGRALGQLDGWALLGSFLCYFPAVPVVALLQELSHYLAARLLGFDITYVVFGAKLKLFDGRLFGHPLKINAYPFMGIINTVTRTWRLLRLRLTLLYLTRSIVCAGAGALALYLAFGEEAPVWAESLAVCGIFGFLNSFFPAEVKTPLATVPNSGTALRQLYARDGKSLLEYSVNSYACEANRLKEQGQIAESIALLEEGLTRYPGRVVLRSGIGNAYLERGEDLRAKQLFEELLTVPELSLLERLTLLNNIAWADLSLGRGHLDEAARYSEEALREAPMLSVFKSTRGAVLIRLGRVEEGLALLQEAQRGSTEAWGRAYNACWLAIGHAALGKPGDARVHLEQARQLNPRCVHLGMATDEVAAAEEALASAKTPSPFRRDHSAK